jgi:hypothetical protein
MGYSPQEAFSASLCEQASSESIQSIAKFFKLRLEDLLRTSKIQLHDLKKGLFSFQLLCISWQALWVPLNITKKRTDSRSTSQQGWSRRMTKSQTGPNSFRKFEHIPQECWGQFLDEGSRIAPN